MLRSTLPWGDFRMLVSLLPAFCSEMGLGKTLNQGIYTAEIKKQTNKLIFSPFSVDFFYLLQRNTSSFSSVSDYFSDWKHYSVFLFPHSRIHISMWNDFLFSFSLSRLPNIFSIIFYFIFYCKMSS